MRATCWSGRNTVQVENVPDPKILTDRDAIVKVTSTAICGSDLHLYGGFVPTMQRGDILGHEFMGEVVETGSAVKNLAAGDRVVVPFPIACGGCNACAAGLFSVCENSNPLAGMAEKLWGHAPAGIFGYSSLTGGYAGGQAEYVRVPFADVGPIKIANDDLSDEQVLFLSDIFPTGYMGAEVCDIEPGHIVAVWGAGPVGLLAIASAYLLGAERVIAIDRFEARLAKAREQDAETLNYEEVGVLEALNELTGGRGPDACIDCVGMEGHHSHALIDGYDRLKQAAKLETERPHAIREAILACRTGGTLSIMGAYGGFMDKFPIGALMNKSLTVKTGQCHVHRYLRPLLERIERGEIDPSFVVSHRMSLDEAPRAYEMFRDKVDDCTKVVLTP
jgi:threonine dehydrogenase-like Zn-dependent dehydrogenase